MLTLNQQRFMDVVETALQKAGSSKRWRNAIVRAAVEIEVNPFIEWKGNSVLILSSSDEIYEANASCQCKAYASGFPCWHRAAARLLQRYNEHSH